MVINLWLLHFPILSYAYRHCIYAYCISPSFVPVTCDAVDGPIINLHTGRIHSCQNIQPESTFAGSYLLLVCHVGECTTVLFLLDVVIGPTLFPLDLFYHRSSFNI